MAAAPRELQFNVTDKSTSLGKLQAELGVADTYTLLANGLESGGDFWITEVGGRYTVVFSNDLPVSQGQSGSPGPVANYTANNWDAAISYYAAGGAVMIATGALAYHRIWKKNKARLQHVKESFGKFNLLMQAIALADEEDARKFADAINTELANARTDEEGNQDYAYKYTRMALEYSKSSGWYLTFDATPTAPAKPPTLYKRAENFYDNVLAWTYGHFKNMLEITAIMFWIECMFAYMRTGVLGNPIGNLSDWVTLGVPALIGFGFYLSHALKNWANAKYACFDNNLIGRLIGAEYPVTDSNKLWAIPLNLFGLLRLPLVLPYLLAYATVVGAKKVWKKATRVWQKFRTGHDPLENKADDTQKKPTPKGVSLEHAEMMEQLLFKATQTALQKRNAGTEIELTTVDEENTTKKNAASRLKKFSSRIGIFLLAMAPIVAFVNEFGLFQYLGWYSGSVSAHIGINIFTSAATPILAWAMFALSIVYMAVYFYRQHKELAQIQKRVDAAVAKIWQVNEADLKDDHYNSVEVTLNARRAAINKEREKLIGQLRAQIQALEKSTDQDAEKNKKQIKQDLAYLNKIPLNEMPNLNDFPSFESGKRTLFLKKVAKRVWVGLTGAMAPIYIVRCLMFVGTALFLPSFLAVSLTPGGIIGIFVAVGVCYGIYKMYSYHLNQQKERDLARLAYMEREHESQRSEKLLMGKIKHNLAALEKPAGTVVADLSHANTGGPTVVSLPSSAVTADGLDQPHIEADAVGAEPSSASSVMPGSSACGNNPSGFLNHRAASADTSADASTARRPFASTDTFGSHVSEQEEAETATDNTQPPTPGLRGYESDV